jgi:membrane associated rhomboid family serine protease
MLGLRFDLFKNRTVELTITLVIVIITVLVSIGGFSNPKIIDDLIFFPPDISRRKQYYRFITHGFIHADFIHLAFNMLAFYSFGQAVETIFGFSCLFAEKGKLFYLLLYFTSFFVASLPDYLKYKNSYHFKSLGASGAVSAVIFAAITLYPQTPITFFFIPVPIPGFIFGILFLAVSVWLDKRGGGNVNHSAHFWGAAYGIVFTLVCAQLFSDLNIYENFLRQFSTISLRQISRPELLPLCD